MHADVMQAVDALEQLASHVSSQWQSGRLLREQWNQWGTPAVGRDDLAAIPRLLAERLRAVDPDELSPELLQPIQGIPRKVQFLLQDTAGFMFNGNWQNAVPAYLSTLAVIAAEVEPLIGWSRITDPSMMPPALARRVRTAKARLDSVEPEIAQLDDKVRRIEQAAEAADQLPTDLQELEQARETVNRTATKAAELCGRIEAEHEKATKASQSTTGLQEQADKLVRQCEEAYRITTSTGLAGAFADRAKWLNRSMWGWVLLLIIALGIAGYFGAQRVKILTAELHAPQPSMGAVGVHLLLAIFSIAAPVWLAWLATKQIGQRFRLAEDYAFKATVAKAYEGYRREAARIDKEMEARLFASALTRLEEAPLRLVETATHGSPWHELLESPGLQKVINAAPDLKDRMTDLIRDALTHMRPTVQGTEKRGEG